MLGKPLALVSQADKTQSEASSRALATTAASAAHGCGLALAALDRPAEACARFEAALSMEPDRADSRLQLAMALYALDKQLQALVELETATHLRPGWADPFRLRGEVYRERGELRKAADDFTEAMKCADGVVDDRVRRGGVRMLLGESQEAIDDFVTALAQGVPAGPPMVKLHTAHAAALRAAGKRKRALRELGIALRHAATNLTLPHDTEENGKGRGSKALGDDDSDDEEDAEKKEKLIAESEQAAFEESENERVRGLHDALLAAVHSMRGQCLHERGQFAGAVRAFDQALRHTPTDAFILAMRAAANYRCERLPAALSDVRAALAPGALPATASDLRADAQQLLGLILARCDHPWGALAALSACVHLQHSAVEEHLADAAAALEAPSQPSSRPRTPTHREAPTMEVVIAHSTSASAPVLAHAASAPTLGRSANSSLQLHRAAPSMQQRTGSQANRQRKSRSGKRGGAKGAEAAKPPARPPSISYALLQRGLVLLLCDRLDAAEEDLSLALKLHPGWGRGHYLRAFAHKGRGQYDAAAADFQAAGNDPSSGQKVDYLHVYHVALQPDALLEEAGWQPLPSVFTMVHEGEEAEDGEEEDPEAASGCASRVEQCVARASRRRRRAESRRILACPRAKDRSIRLELSCPKAPPPSLRRAAPKRDLSRSARSWPPLTRSRCPGLRSRLPNY